MTKTDVENYLLKARCWRTASHILADFGHSIDETNKRELRDFLSESDRIISGDRGYAHMAAVTPDETEHFVARQLSQIRAMGRRTHRIRRAYQEMMSEEMTPPIL